MFAPILIPERKGAQPLLVALVPCAGTGTRAGTPQPKQYEMVAGQPMVLHTLQALAGVQALSAVVVAVSPGDRFFDRHPGPWQAVACGGATRADTVRAGLAELRSAGLAEHDWVLVHDAARCLVTPALVQSLIAACTGDAVGGLLALPLPDTLKQGVDGRVAATLERADKWLAQTPQMFRLGPLLQALEAAAADGSGAAITDEASAMERLGHRPRLVASTARNFKVTYPDDFALAAALLEART